MVTKVQAELLKRMIAADRRYWLKSREEPCSQDDRGVEVGWINDVNPRTAASLVEAGLGEIVDLGNTYASRPCIFLGNYNVTEPFEGD